jgi:DNA uptake protein ComE-like DNA-binding protein
MSLRTLEASGLLEGIKNHARAGNFDLVSIQSRSLVAEMESAIQASAENTSEFRQALPAVRALILDGTRSDSQSALHHVDEAKDALGILPGVTPAWPTTPGKTPAHAGHPAEKPSAPEIQRQVRHAPKALPPIAPFPEVVDINTAPAEDVRKAFGVDESATEHILRNRPYRGWQDFSEKNPGFSEARLRSLRQAGVSISRTERDKIPW